MHRLMMPLDALLAQRGHLFPWVPVCLALGVGIFFKLPAEPTGWAYLILSATTVISLCLAWIFGVRWSPVFIAIALVSGGLTLAGYRAHSVHEPVMGWRYYGPIEGRIITIDRSASDATRLTLDRVVLERIGPERTPALVRVSLHGDQTSFVPEPGVRIALSGHLSPPSGPAEPGGFDFQRMAWFQGLGAVGYTRSPVLAMGPAGEGAAGLAIYRFRKHVSLSVQTIIPGEAGAFAAAILTGDRSGMGQGTLRALRASNLAHLLAISGLHMGLLTGFVFAVIRFGFALIPFVALRWPVKKIAAAAALMAGAAYLAISGGNVATERAFIMVGVMLCAILLGRRALTLRAVAMAAVIVLLLRPEALTGPGFQMSFAATTALVAVFGSLRSFQKLRLPGWIKSIAAVVISSAVAGLATAPFAAAHFNQIAHFGLIANLLSVPLMGILVMPAAVLAACLAPLGLAWVGLELMRLGLVWILGVAHWISERDGALGHVITPDPVVIPLMTFGFLTVILWQGRARWVGLAPAIIAFVLWDQTERPNVLVAQSGALIGVLTPEGRALNKQKGDGFTAQNWLENDGNPIPQAEANALAGIDVDGKISNISLGEFSITQIAGQRALSAFPDCSGASLLVTTVEDEIERSCPVFDVPALRLTGALAIYTDGEEIKIVTASDLSGARLWNTRAARINALSFGQFEFLNTFE